MENFVFYAVLISLYPIIPLFPSKRVGRGPEAFAQRCSVKKVFLEISQNSQENTCARVSFLMKLQASDLVSI